MSGLEMLDAFIGLVGIYLTLSLLVTAIGEGISQALGLRGRNLRQVFTGLIGKARTTVFYLHPRIRQLMQYDDPGNALRKLWLRLGFGLPSYIPADIATEVLLEQQLGAPLSQLSQSPLEIQQRLEQLPVSATSSSLRHFWQQAHADPLQFQYLVQDWFNDRCDRAVGWFKRKLGILQLLIGLVVAVGMNVDSIALYQKLFSDPLARQQVVLLAESLAANSQLATELCREDKSQCMDTLTLKQQLTQTAPLLGHQDTWLWPWQAPTVWFGYLLTAFALSLGAPFWFDILQKLMAVKQKFRRSATASSETTTESQSNATTTASTAVNSHAAATTGKKLNSLAAIDLQLARLSDLVYLNGPQLDLELQTFMLKGQLRSVGEDTQYLYARGADYDVLICRGTEGKLADIRTDAQCPLVQWPLGSNSKAHQGFSAQADVILADLQQQQPQAGLERPLWITGHSLGGALAILLALQLSKIHGSKLAGVVTFGQPKVGDALLTQAITQQLLPFYRRYVNQRDIVPKLPPLPDYRHSGQLYYFDDLDQLQLNPPRWLMLLDQVLCDADQAEAALRQHLDDHKMKNYVSLLAKQSLP
jgi:hypothetical protein